MQLFSKGILLIGTILLVACSDKPAVETTETTQSNQPADAVDEIRTILIQSDTKCVLRVQKGRDDPELINPTSCTLAKGPDGHINSVLVAFNPPCKQYSLKNLIGDLYFLDEKSIAGRNKACRIESFKASYAWKIEQS